MTSEKQPVRVEELDIVRAPGFETGGFALEELSPGVNLVYGPNAAGKTTTADSIEKVLWPDAADGSEQFVGQLALNGEQIRVEVMGGRAEYQRNGQEATAPAFPSPEQRDRYRLSLHELLQTETRNESFAKTIERESAGGFDLPAAHDDLGYKSSTITRGKSEYKDAKQAVEALREERSEAKSLEEDRSRLTRLERELEKARQARYKTDALEQAITYREAVSACEAAKEAVAEFPDVLDEVDGDELQEVEELESEVEDLQRERQAAEQSLVEAQQTLEAVDLPDEGVSKGMIAGLKDRRETVRDGEADTKQLSGEIADVKTKRERARKEIPLEIAHEDLVDIDLGTWEEVSAFAGEAYKVQANRDVQAKVQRWAEETNPPNAELQDLKRGSRALEEWLSTVPEAESDSGGAAAFRMGIVSAVVVSLAGVALGVLVNPFLFGVVLVGVGLLVYGYLQQAGDDESGNERAPHRDSFAQLGLAEPASWTEEAVQKRLVQLYDEIAEHEIIEERQQQRNALLDEQELDSKEETLAKKREQLQETLGVAPDTTDLELAVIVRRVLDWQEAHEEVVGLEAELAEAQANLAASLERLQDELAEYGYDDIADAAAAKQAIRDLEQRISEHEDATRELEDAQEISRDAEQEIAELEDRREAVFTTLDLESGDHESLRSLCDQVAEYEQAKQEVQGKKEVVKQEEQKLEALPEFDPEFKEAELQDLRAELRDVEETAAQHDELQEKIKGIEAKIETAKTGTAVEDAIAEKDRALNTLEEQLNDDYAAMVGDVLVDHIEEVTIEASRPAVFERANEILAVITHGRYRLALAEGADTFRAYDTVKQKGLALDELSSGTRVQVLLAVRLAFVEQQEQGAKLPIVLDETLANTDDLRAEVIIESLIELAREGRQIFYFTAQGDEVAKWQAALEDVDDVEWTTIDLAAVRNLENGVHVPDIDTVESFAPAPPDPDGHDHASYRDVIDVESFNPYAGAAAAHLWYVVDDVEVLHDILEMGIDCWGPLQNLFDRGRGDMVPADPEVIKTMQQNAAALDEFAQSWCIGRGEPVDREVLEACGAVSNTFIDRVTELADELNGDGEALVDALIAGEVNRFRRGKAEELEEYLREDGYIVSREPLDDDSIKLRMVERLMEQDVPRKAATERTTELLERIR